MSDEHDAFDLAKYIEDNDIKPMDRINTDGVDLSGRPVPKDVRVVLDSGVEVRCEVKYDGIDPGDGNRRYKVLAEIDWENHWPTTIIVGEYPTDVTLNFVSLLGMDENSRRAAQLRLIAERII